MEQVLIETLRGNNILQQTLYENIVPSEEFKAKSFEKDNGK